MRSSKSLPSLVIGALFVGGVSLWPAQARASEEFPGAIYEAANMPCIPDCSLCHRESPGTAVTWTRSKLGTALRTGMPPAVAGNADSLKAAFAAFKANTFNAAAVAALARGEDPEGVGDICTPIYGCGGTIAHKPVRRSTDPTATVAGVLALLAGLLVMRRRRR